MSTLVERLPVIVEYDEEARNRVLASMLEKDCAPSFSSTASLMSWLEED